MKLRSDGRASERTRLSSEQGFTLVEMLVSMVASLAIFGAILALMIVSLDATAANTSQVAGNDAVTRALERVSRELRQATQVSSISSGGSAITLHEYVTSTGSPPAAIHSVTWDCSQQDSSGYYCTRQDTTGGGGKVTEITGLTSANVFSSGTLANSASSYAPVSVTFSQAVSGSSNPLVLTEEITPRDCQYAGSGYGLPCDHS